MNKRVNLYLSEDLQKKLDKIAKNQNRSKSNMVAYLIDNFFKNLITINPI